MYGGTTSSPSPASTMAPPATLPSRTRRGLGRRTGRTPAPPARTRSARGISPSTPGAAACSRVGSGSYRRELDRAEVGERAARGVADCLDDPLARGDDVLEDEIVGIDAVLVGSSDRCHRLVDHQDVGA